MINDTPLVPLTDSQKEQLLRWAGWLEDTDLQQGTGFLRSLSEKYCCLGLYIHYAHPENNWKKIRGREDALCVWRGRAWSQEFLPPRMRRELGLDHKLPDFSHFEECFSEMNDSLRYSFSTIAEEIRHLVKHGDFTEDTMLRLGLKEELL